MTQPIDLAEIKGRLAAATPGPLLCSEGYPLLTRHDLCAACGKWTPVLDPEASDHLNDCAALKAHDEFMAARAMRDFRAPTDIAALVAEVERLRADLADRDLALAMARGEEWPEGWEWSESDEGYQSPADDAYIRPKTVNHLGPKGMEGAPLGWSLYRRDKKIRGMSRGDKVTYPDALSALRAYQAMVTP